MMSPVFNPVMRDFIAQHSIMDLFLPRIALAEIRFGIKCLPAGKRQAELERNLELCLASGFATRLIAFGAGCAAGYAVAHVTREASGRPVSMQDEMIGGMALTYGATLATRNVPDFDGYGLSLVNPWDVAP